MTRMVSPWYLKGLENSMYWALSLLMVRGATIMSAWPLSNSPIIPFHSFLLLLFTCKDEPGQWVSVETLTVVSFVKPGLLQNAQQSVHLPEQEEGAVPAAQTHPLLSAKLAIAHEVNFIGEIHGLCKLDQ